VVRANKNVLFCLSLILSGFSCQSMQGQSAADGIYSADQAHRGEALYKKQCLSCHGEALDGVGPYPPLSGDDFLSKYEGRKQLTFSLTFSASTNFPQEKRTCPATPTASKN